MIITISTSLSSQNTCRAKIQTKIYVTQKIQEDFSIFIILHLILYLLQKHNGYPLFQQHRQLTSELAPAADLDLQVSPSSATCAWKIRHLVSKHTKQLCNETTPLYTQHSTESIMYLFSLFYVCLSVFYCLFVYSPTVCLCLCMFATKIFW